MSIHNGIMYLLNNKYILFIISYIKIKYLMLL